MNQKKEKTERIREEIKKHLADLLPKKDLPQQAQTGTADMETGSSATGLQPSSAAPGPSSASAESGSSCNKENNTNNINNNNNNQGEEQEQAQGQNQENLDESRDTITVQNAREWTPLECGQHPKLEEIREAYSNMPMGHPELLFLFAVKSDFGYWLWMPTSKNYYGVWSHTKKGDSSKSRKGEA